MTEEGAKQILRDYRVVTGGFIDLREAIDIATQALEEIQQYRAIGTVERFAQLEKQFKPHNVDETSCHLRHCNKCDMYRKENEQYRAIGTIEEFKALKEKKSDWKYSRKENIATCKNCSYEHYLGTYHQYATNYCPKCGSKMTET